MRAPKNIERLVSALRVAPDTEGRNVIGQYADALRERIRGMVATKSLVPGPAPIVMWVRPGQSREAETEAWAWLISHVALGHLKSRDEHEMVVATLDAGYQLPVDRPAEEILERARTDLTLKGYLWSAHLFLSDPDPQRVMHGVGGSSPVETAKLAKRVGVPEPLVELWLKCRDLPAQDMEAVIGRPQAWAEDVIERARKVRSIDQRGATRRRMEEKANASSPDPRSSARPRRQSTRRRR